VHLPTAALVSTVLTAKVALTLRVQMAAGGPMGCVAPLELRLAQNRLTLAVSAGCGVQASAALPPRTALCASPLQTVDGMANTTTVGPELQKDRTAVVIPLSGGTAAVKIAVFQTHRGTRTAAP
jgi:hypothetical protein